MDSLHEIEEVELDTSVGYVVPKYVITVFYKIQCHRIHRTKGKLKIGGTSNGPRRRGRHDDDEDDDMDVDGDAKQSPMKKAAYTTKKGGGMGSVAAKMAAGVGLIGTIFAAVPSVAQAVNKAP